MLTNNIEYTSVSDLIEQLEELRAKGLGDCPVCVNGISPVRTLTRPYYYDGGYLVRDATKSSRDFLSSRIRGEKGLKMREGVKDTCVDIQSFDVTESSIATIDGRTVRDMDPEVWSFLDRKEQEEIAIFGGIVKYKLIEEYDKEQECYPFMAYLDSGESAIGNSMQKAKEKLKEQFQN